MRKRHIKGVSYIYVNSYLAEIDIDSFILCNTNKDN